MDGQASVLPVVEAVNGFEQEEVSAAGEVAAWCMRTSLGTSEEGLAG
jgi:hypothetical protein